jgi:hypothetical protein
MEQMGKNLNSILEEFEASCYKFCESVFVRVLYLLKQQWCTILVRLLVFKLICYIIPVNHF